MILVKWQYNATCQFLVDDVYDGPLRTFPYPGCPRLPVVQSVREWEGRSEVSEPQLQYGYQVSLKM